MNEETKPLDDQAELKARERYFHFMAKAGATNAACLWLEGKLREAAADVKSVEAEIANMRSRRFDQASMEEEPAFKEATQRLAKSRLLRDVLQPLADEARTEFESLAPLRDSLDDYLDQLEREQRAHRAEESATNYRPVGKPHTTSRNPRVIYPNLD